MELICAIDLLDGGAVRLVQGDFDRRVPAGSGAPELARRFVAAGCRRIHVVDLAGARAGTPMQLPLVGEVAAAGRAVDPACRVEATGGLRSDADVDAALDGWLRVGRADEPAELARQLVAAGASRLVVTDTGRDGTLGGPNLALLGSLRDALPDAILVAAGGVGSLEDLRALDALGVDGAIVGVALLTGAVDVADAMAALG